MSNIAPDVRSEAPRSDDRGMVVRSIASQLSFGHGSRSGIGTTAVQITSTSVATRKGVLVKAGNSNLGVVFIGNSGVTAGTVDATDGFELDAGESVIIEIDNVNKLFVIGSAVGQRVFWVAI